MSRETSPLILGDFWLDKRRDGKAPDIWQIARYAPNSRSVVYLSTKCRTLETAKPKIEAHYAAEKAKEHQTAQDALVIPQLILYIRENKDRIKSIAQSKSSMRCFIGFLMRDEVGIDATFASLTPSVWKRFIKWRQGPHAYEVEWDGSLFSHASDGVSGEAIQRNLDDVRAALNYALGEERVSLAPRVPSVDRRLRSKPRNALFTVAELGAIVGYARSDPAALRWVLLMIPEDMKATTARYAKYDPRYLAKTKRLLTKLFKEVETAADRWAADHLRTISARGRPAQIIKVQKSVKK
ncbi:hypothetical protein [Sphingomonas sp. YL-JM2C]